MSNINNRYLNFYFFENTKNGLVSSLLVWCGRLTNLFLFSGSDKVCPSSIRSDNFIESYQLYHLLLQTDRLTILWNLKLKINFTSYKEMLHSKFCKSICSIQFSNKTFFRISYDLSRKWNLEIYFFQVEIQCNFPNFGLIEKCY